MKTLQIASIITVLAVVCLSVGFVSALTTNDATIHAQLSNPAPRAGDSILVTVNFQSNTASQLHILAIGVHADWMQADQLLGPTYSGEPQVVEANGAYSVSFSIQVPSTASTGSHTYNIGVDVLDTNNNYFSFNSADSQIQVQSASSSTGPTSNPNGQTGTTDWLPYIVVAAAAVVVVVLVLVVMMRSRKARKPTAKSFSEAPASPNSEEPKPNQKPDSQDFNI